MPHPVELLRDEKGVYGIGVAEEAKTEHSPRDLILRSDRLAGIYDRSALQMIPFRFSRRMLRNMKEERLRKEIHHALLRQKGLRPQDFEGYFERGVPRQQSARNWQIYHGLRLQSLSIVNGLIASALDEAADQAAIKIARRFRFRFRFDIYRDAALSPRALQIAAVFPVLAVALFGMKLPFRKDLVVDYFNDIASEKALSERFSILQEAEALIEAGAPLKTIADLMGVPMAFKKIKPGAVDVLIANLALGTWDKRFLRAYMPDSLLRQKLWLSSVNHICGCLGDSYVEWVARHLPEIPGSPREVASSFSDIVLWFRASHIARNSVKQQPLSIRQRLNRETPWASGDFVVRPFSPDMSLKTVIKLSDDWHEAVANNMSGPSYEFPEPWCCAGEACGYEILPITNSAELYRERHALHHWVGAQDYGVKDGTSYFYSIRKSKSRVAILELLRERGGIVIGGFRGAWNSEVPKEIKRAVQNWLRSQRVFRFPKKVESRLRSQDDIHFPKEREVATVVRFPKKVESRLRSQDDIHFPKEREVATVVRFPKKVESRLRSQDDIHFPKEREIATDPLDDGIP